MIRRDEIDSGIGSQPKYPRVLPRNHRSTSTACQNRANAEAPSRTASPLEGQQTGHMPGERPRAHPSWHAMKKTTESLSIKGRASQLQPYQRLSASPLWSLPNNYELTTEKISVLMLLILILENTVVCHQSLSVLLRNSPFRRSRIYVRL